MKDKIHNMNSIIKNHKIEDHVMSLEPWLWNRSSEERIPWFSTNTEMKSICEPKVSYLPVYQNFCIPCFFQNDCLVWVLVVPAMSGTSLCSQKINFSLLKQNDIWGLQIRWGSMHLKQLAKRLQWPQKTSQFHFSYFPYLLTHSQEWICSLLSFQQEHMDLCRDKTGMGHMDLLWFTPGGG